MENQKKVEEIAKRNEIRLNRHSETIELMKDRINKLEKNQLETNKDHQIISSLLERVEQTAHSLDNTVMELRHITQELGYRLNSVETQVSNAYKEVKEIRDKPAKRYEGIVSTIITVIVTSIITYIMTKAI